MRDKHTLQNYFLEALIEENAEVLIYLINGVRIYGQIDSYDVYVITLKGIDRRTLYKHAISTIQKMDKFIFDGVTR